MLTETANHVSPDMPEDGSMHESLTMEQFNSPLVSPQYKSTYAIVATSGEFYNTRAFASWCRKSTDEIFFFPAHRTSNQLTFFIALFDFKNLIAIKL